MNNLTKDYMNASHSLLDFLKAFESALEQRENDFQLVKYKQIHENKYFLYCNVLILICFLKKK
jgi:hypothetical protein